MYASILYNNYIEMPELSTLHYWIKAMLWWNRGRFVVSVAIDQLNKVASFINTGDLNQVHSHTHTHTHSHTLTDTHIHTLIDTHVHLQGQTNKMVLQTPETSKHSHQRHKD